MAQRQTLGDEDPIVLLARALPASSDAAVGDDLDRRARATLSYLVDAMLVIDELPQPIELDPTVCPNCGEPAPSVSSPYCSECCKQHSAFVRQMRDSIATGTILDEHRQTMKGEVLWRLLGAGLPRRLALVPENARQRVFKRSEGKCEICGAPATTIDNTGSG